MTAPSDKTVFLSWSGERSKAIAEALKKWLPTLVDDIEPWASSVSIQAGNQWLGEVNKNLDSAMFGIVIVTSENKSREWVNFEAGALSQRFVGDARGSVVPLMADFDHPTELPTTLSQFQAVPMTDDGLWRLAKALAKTLGKKETVVRTRFDGSLSDLRSDLDAALQVKSASAPRSIESKVDELLQSTRAFGQEKMEFDNAWQMGAADETSKIAQRFLDSQHIHGIREYHLNQGPFQNLVYVIKDGQPFTPEQISNYETILSIIHNTAVRILTKTQSQTSPLLEGHLVEKI
ncbi:TIR domain-containing protein [Rhodococcus fascians]|nr:TIR domain-containing protein [Rhodococcus fascians]MBY4236576.1 TIR domain-containing protein [Rhodococcus fascians]MBY4252058.1 TIR domain-containing protein [Rhodococcus fascians]MBY4267920.1 TIR domain-containing protein [Rhodococcus fascians]